MSTEILQRSKKKNIIFEEIIIPRFISIFVSASAVTPAPISTVKTTKTMKPIQQKLINEIRAKADPHKIILRMLDQPFSITIREFLINSTDL